MHCLKHLSNSIFPKRKSISCFLVLWSKGTTVWTTGGEETDQLKFVRIKFETLNKALVGTDRHTTQIYLNNIIQRGSLKQILDSITSLAEQSQTRDVLWVVLKCPLSKFKICWDNPLIMFLGCLPFEVVLISRLCTFQIDCFI